MLERRQTRPRGLFSGLASRVLDAVSVNTTVDRSLAYSLQAALRLTVVRIQLVVIYGAIRCGLGRRLPRRPGMKLMVVGSQKAGTTSIDSLLRHSTTLCLPPRKEVHFWDRGHIVTLPSYLGLFAKDRECAEVAPDYAVLPLWIARVIAHTFPEALFVLVLRHPAERAWSAARMEASARLNSELPADEQLIQYLGSSRCVERSNYRPIVDKWRIAVGPSRLHILDFDKLSSDPEASVSTLLRAAGCSPALLPTAGGRPSTVEFRGYHAEPSPRVKAVLDEIYAPFVEDYVELVEAEMGEPVRDNRR